MFSSFSFLRLTSFFVWNLLPILSSFLNPIVFLLYPHSSSSYFHRSIYSFPSFLTVNISLIYLQFFTFVDSGGRLYAGHHRQSKPSLSRGFTNVLFQSQIFSSPFFIPLLPPSRILLCPIAFFLLLVLSAFAYDILLNPPTSPCLISFLPTLFSLVLFPPQGNSCHGVDVTIACIIACGSSSSSSSHSAQILCSV